ncbi:MAG: DUF4838 domain-containing protein, partial [Phycisphaeraceae bacterium]
MGAALNKPLTDPVNADYQSNLKGWTTLAERMYLWMYAQTGNKGGLAFSAPLPTVFVYDEDFRNIHEHGFDGVFVEGAYRLIDAFGELRSYVLSRLAWDPTLDAEPLIDEFLAGVYGDAAVYLRRYLDLLREADARHDQNIRYGFSVWDIRMFDAPTMLEAERLLDRAERAVAGGPESLRRRVRRFRLPHDGVMLAKWDDLAAEAAQQDLDWPSNREARLAQVEATANWWIEQRNERRPHSYALRRTRERVDEFVEEQRRLMALERKPLPAFFDQFDPEDVYSFTPERFRVGHREKWSVRRDDPEAASGRAAVQFGDVGRMQTTVLLQTIGLYDHRTPDQRWDVYVSAKVHADADMTGEAFCIGYHSRNDEHKRRHWISFDQVERGEYHLYKMPDLRLTEAGHLWLCPAGRDGIGEIYYDRFILVRQSE